MVMKEEEKNIKMGYDVLNKPTYNHDCNKCTFYKCVRIYYKKGKIKDIDIYFSCDNRLGRTPWLIRYSNDPSDYITTNLEGLVFWWWNK